MDKNYGIEKWSNFSFPQKYKSIWMKEKIWISRASVIPFMVKKKNNVTILGTSKGIKAVDWEKKFGNQEHLYFLSSFKRMNVTRLWTSYDITWLLHCFHDCFHYLSCLTKPVYSVCVLMRSVHSCVNWHKKPCVNTPGNKWLLSSLLTFCSQTCRER